MTKFLDLEPLDDSFQRWIERKLNSGYTIEQIINIIGLWLARLSVQVVAEKALREREIDDRAGQNKAG